MKIPCTISRDPLKNFTQDSETGEMTTPPPLKGFIVQFLPAQNATPPRNWGWPSEPVMVVVVDLKGVIHIEPTFSVIVDFDEYNRERELHSGVSVTNNS